MISIITPVLDQPQFIADYARAVAGADEVIIVDTGCTPENRGRWASIQKLIFYPHAGHNYGHWCNAGYTYSEGDIVVFLNNDIAATGDWLEQVRDIEHGAIYGPELQAQIIDGVTVPFLSGWCIAATRATWERMKPYEHTGPWNTISYPAAGYWEDNALCFEAMLLGIRLVQTQWPISHLNGGNNTSKARPAYYADVTRNRATFARRVREALHNATV
jgi:GT2 family glycosyltransferase